jgi:hypothetical protein
VKYTQRGSVGAGPSNSGCAVAVTVSSLARRLVDQQDVGVRDLHSRTDLS